MVKIVEVSATKVAKDGRHFFTAGFRAGFGQKIAKRTFWQQFKRDANGNNTDELYWERATPDEAMALMKSGELVEATKETRTVESYEVGNNLVNSYTTIVFPDERVEAVFAAQDHSIVDEESGEVLFPHLKRKAKAVISATAVEA